MQDDPGLAEILRARPAAYNRQADELERRSAEYDSGAQMLQVAVLEQTRLVGRLGTNGERITEALRVWAKAMAWTILGGPIDLCWQPVVYRAAPVEGPGDGADSPAGGSPSRQFRTGRRGEQVATAVL